MPLLKINSGPGSLLQTEIIQAASDKDKEFHPREHVNQWRVITFHTGSM